MMMATDLDLDDVASQSNKAQRELKELRDTLTAVADALDYLHGMTPQQAADARKDAERYRWLRDNRWPPILHADIVLHRNARWDAEIDAAMAASATVGAA